MKYANLLHMLAALTVLLFAVLKMLHIGDGNFNGMLTIALVVAYSAVTWKTKLLEKEISDYKERTGS